MGASQSRSVPTPASAVLDSQQYADDFNEVKAFGEKNSSVRTADETEFAHFWADVPGRAAAPPWAHERDR